MLVSPGKFWFVLLPLAGEGGRRPGEGRASGCANFANPLHEKNFLSDFQNTNA